MQRRLSLPQQFDLADHRLHIRPIARNCGQGIANHGLIACGTQGATDIAQTVIERVESSRRECRPHQPQYPAAALESLAHSVHRNG